jgi:hypothetical protein
MGLGARNRRDVPHPDNLVDSKNLNAVGFSAQTEDYGLAILNVLDLTGTGFDFRAGNSVLTHLRECGTPPHK